jgi:hypothetical protein
VLFRHPFQRMFERRFVQGLAEFIQRLLGGLAECAGRGRGVMAIGGNLHLDADSANLEAPAPHHGRQLRGELAYFRGDAGIGDGDAEHAEMQAQYLDPAGLRKIGRNDADKMASQSRQDLGFGQYRTQFLVAAQQCFQALNHKFFCYFEEGEA